MEGASGEVPAVLARQGHQARGKRLAILAVKSGQGTIEAALGRYTRFNFAL
jgi:hypothetical protein